MKKMLAFTICLCLLAAPCAFAEGTIGGEAFVQAQYIPDLLESVSSYVYSIFEYADDGELDYAESYWFGKAEDDAIAICQTESDGSCTYTANGMSILWDAETQTIETYVYTPDAYEAMLEDLFSFTMIYLADEIEALPLEDGALLYAYSDEESEEYCAFDADTWHIIAYEYNQIADEETQPVEQIYAEADAALTLPEPLETLLSGTMYTVTIHFDDDTQMEYTVPADVPTYLMDETYVMLSLSADMTQLVDSLSPGFDAEAWAIIGKD